MQERPLLPDVLRGRLVAGDPDQIKALKELEGKPKKKRALKEPWYARLNPEQIEMIKALGGSLYDPHA